MTLAPILWSEDRHVAYVLCSPEFVERMTDEWHGPVHMKIEGGMLILRTPQSSLRERVEKLLDHREGWGDDAADAWWKVQLREALEETS